jgi:hypothetical protein
MYRVYSGPRGSAITSPLEKQRLLFKELDTIDAAINWARHLSASGRAALLIEGDDGTRLDQEDLVVALAQAGPPAAEHAVDRR